MTNNSQTAKELFAGSMAGMAQVLVGQPFDTVKVRLQTTQTYSGALDCAKRTLQAEGVGGFYKVLVI
jgi:solute carrier family 25 carnitine/acylcarnitine transporter 20/29